MSKGPFSLVLFLFTFSSLAIAQSSLSGAVSGSAWDAHHAAVSGARITLQNSDSGEHYEAHTGEQGTFRIADLKPGMYTLTATSAAFAEFQIQHISVEVGRITEVEIPFAVAGTGEVVEVRGEAPAVNTTQPDFANNVDVAAIENLPINGRRWSNFAQLTPTVTLDGNFGLISFRRGISGLMNNSTVDGSDNNQAFFSEERGRTRISYVISQASVREFQVNTSNFSAEYGRAGDRERRFFSIASCCEDASDGIARSFTCSAYTPFMEVKFLRVYRLLAGEEQLRSNPK
jgi:hypothetical protein